MENFVENAVLNTAKEMVEHSMSVQRHLMPEMSKLEQFASQGYDIMPKSQFFDFMKDCEKAGLAIDFKRSIIAGKEYVSNKYVRDMIFVVSPKYNEEEYTKAVCLMPMKFGEFIH